MNNISFENGKIEKYFEDGYAANYGGAIQIQYRSYDYQINNCNFTNNTATTCGGAINCVSEGIIDNCRFINNTGVQYGGAITYNHDYYCYIRNSVFLNNTVNEGGYGGGAIYMLDGTLSVQNSVFINNSAVNQDGAAINAYNKVVQVVDSVFLDNTGKYILMGYSSLSAERCWFGNTKEDYDVTPDVYFAITIDDWRFLDIDTTSLKNTAVINVNNVYDDSSNEIDYYSYYTFPDVKLKITNHENLTISEEEIILKNGKYNLQYQLTSDSGLLTVEYNDTIKASKEIKIGNFTKLQDLIDSYPENSVIVLDCNYTYTIGYEYLTEGIVINKNLTIDGNGSTIDAQGQARIFDVMATNVTFKNINFVNGRSYKGSAINLEIDNNEPIEFNIINCTFTNNVATLTDTSVSGAVRIVAKDGNYNIINSAFSNNVAPSGSSGGGAVYIEVENANFNVNNCRFINNSGRKSGTIGINTQNTESSVNYTIFINNTGVDGKAIYFADSNGGNLLVNNSVFLDNKGAYDINNVEGNVVADYNWWGNIAGSYSNYYKTNLYVLKTGKPTYWVFVNSTLESAVISSGSTLTTKLFFQLYNSVTDEVDSFDNDRLPKLNLNLTAEGEISRNKIFVNEEFVYTATEGGYAHINASCYGFVYPIDIYLKSEITLLNDTIILYYGDNPLLSKFATLNHYGKLKFTSSDPGAVGITTGSNPKFVQKWADGEAVITVSFTGDEHYAPAEAQFTVKIVKIPLIINGTNLDTNSLNLNVDDTFNLTVELVVDLQGQTYHTGYATPSWAHFSTTGEGAITPYGYQHIIEVVKKGTGNSGILTINALNGGNLNLTLYYTNDAFSFQMWLLTLQLKDLKLKLLWNLLIHFHLKLKIFLKFLLM